MTEIALLLGAGVGLVLGLTGAGGSIMAVPLLMAGLGWSLQQAVPVALMAVCAAATFGAYTAWRKSYVRYRAALLMGALGILTAPLGLKAAALLPETALALLFSTVMIIVALRLILQARVAPQEASIVRATVQGDGAPARGPICRLTPRGRIRWTLPCGSVLAVIGAVTGFLSGLLGVGGGFVVVPSLRAATELSIHSAVATSLMVIALTSGGGVIASAWTQGHALPWLIAAPFIAGSLAGMAGGSWLAPRIAGPRLQQGFACLMLLSAAGLFTRTLLFVVR